MGSVLLLATPSSATRSTATPVSRIQVQNLEMESGQLLCTWKEKLELRKVIYVTTPVLTLPSMLLVNLLDLQCSGLQTLMYLNLLVERQYLLNQLAFHFVNNKKNAWEKKNWVLEKKKKKKKEKKS